MNKKERINEAYNYLRFKGVIRTQNDVAAKIGSSRPNISSALAGRESVLTDSFIARFCASFPEISYTWLLLGKGDMLTDIEKSIQDRIRDVLKMNIVSASSLAEEEPLFESLQNDLDCDNNIDEAVIDKLCELFKVRKEWMLTGKGDMIDITEEQQQPLVKPRLPVSAAAGTLSDYLCGIKSEECEQLPIIRNIPDYDFTMLVKGNSMEPKFEGGDEIACKEVKNVIEWGKTYVLATRDGAVLKRLYEDENGVRCVSYNHDEYPDFIVKGEDILGVYKVVGLIRV